MIEKENSKAAGKESEYQLSGRKAPKNVRQFGYFTGDLRIYMEDYVHTFTRWLAEQDYSARCAAVLVGEFAKSEHTRDVYAYGTVVIEDACVQGKLELSGDTWTGIYENIKRYFPEGEIVGWFYGGASFTTEEWEQLRQIHLDYFAGSERILMVYDFLEREEEFYRLEGSELAKQTGYYVYYEKNEEMQTYMIDKKQGKHKKEETDDRAVREMRARLGVRTQTKDMEENEGVVRMERAGRGKEGDEKNLRYAHTAGIVLAAIAVIAGASMVYSQERLKSFEQTLNQIVGAVANASDEPQKQADITGGNIFDDPEVLETFQPQPSPELSAAPPEEEPTPVPTPEATTPAASVSPTATQPPEGITPTPDASQKAEDELTAAPTKPAEQPTVTPTNEPTIEPSKEPETEETDGNGVVDSTKYQYYIVKPGDTLAGICMKLYGNLEQLEFIKGLNQITNEDLIYVDQELLVP